MAYIYYIKMWESEFDNIYFEKDKVEDMNFNQLKLEVQDTYQKVEKLTLCFQPTDDTDNQSSSRWKIVKNKRSLNFIRKRLQQI